MRELDAAYVEPFLDTQQPTIHEHGQSVGRGTGLREAAQQLLLRNVLAESGLRQKLIFDDPPHLGRLIGEAAFVEVRQNARV